MKINMTLIPDFTSFPHWRIHPFSHKIYHNIEAVVERNLFNKVRQPFYSIIGAQFYSNSKSLMIEMLSERRKNDKDEKNQPI